MSEIGDYPGAFPSSRKVHLEGPSGIQVPMREIQLSGGEPPLRVYDTSGPRRVDPRLGLPALRDAWIRVRPVGETGRSREPAEGVEMPSTLARRTLRGSACVTQMKYARDGEITPEMEFVALREGVDPAFVRDEVA
ncbi:MAG: phosphomethylpyrimidine synthase ThiC, partial [Gemmatimonadota bacterium]